MAADDRRLALVLAHRAAVVLEAPAGFGKSHLLRRVAAHIDHAELVTTADGLATLAGDPAALPPRACVLIDVAAPDLTHVERLADHPNLEMLVIAGRVVDRRIRDIMGRYDCLELTSDDLALTEAEISALLDTGDQRPDPALVDVIRAQTDGWPIAITALASHARARSASVLDDPAVLRRGLAHHPVIDQLLRDTVAALPADLALPLTRYGLIEQFTAAAFDAVTENGATRCLVEHGVPVLESADGWLRLPTVLRVHLGDEIAADDAQRIAPHLAQSGGVLPAARTLVASGSLRAAARLLVETPQRQLDDAEPHELLGLLDALGTFEEPVPLGLIRARVLENLGNVHEARRTIDDLVGALQPSANGWVDARLEQLRHAAMNDDVGPDTDLLLDLTSAKQQTRLREVMGLRAAQSADPARVEEAIGLLDAAAGEWQALGDPTRAASVLRTMAAVALTHLGRYPEAIDAASRARRLCTHRLYDRALSSVLILRLAGLAGRADVIEREVPAAESLAASVKLPWLEHYVAASQSHAAAFSDRPDDALMWSRRAESSLGGLRTHSTAVVFHAEMAVALTVAERPDEAAHHLGLARERRDDNPVEVAIAEATVAARRGDLAIANRWITELESDPSVPATRLWRPRLEVAIAAGDVPAVDAAKATAQLIGLRDLADRLAAPASTAVSIRVLGGLEVRRGGRLLATPTGKPAELLKLLVCRDGTVSAEVAIDALWDDLASTEQGLRRLKNPVNRLREAIGADAIMRSSVGIHLGASVDTDLARFTTAASRATGFGGGREASLAAVEALNLFEPLLPDDAPSDLVANRNIDLVATASGLFDLVLDQPDPDRPSSSWLLETARRIDLYAEHWFVTIAQLALDEHNLVHARQALALAQAAAVELDVPESPEIAAIAARLGPERSSVRP